MSSLNIATKTLLAAAPVTALAGQRIWPIYAPQAQPMPNIIVHLIHEDEEDLLAGASQIRQGRVSVESRTLGIEATKLFTLGEAVIDAFRDKTEFAIAGCIATIRKEGSDETTASEQADAQGVPDTVRRITDFYITWRRAP